MNGGGIPELDYIVDVVHGVETGSMHAEALGHKQFPEGWHENYAQFDPLRQHRSKIRRVGEPGTTTRVC